MQIMELHTITLDREALYILKTIRNAGFEAYIVGGAVRDLLINMRQAYNAGQSSETDVQVDIEPPNDYDFTTNAKPEEILSLFPEAFYENEFGTVMITPEDLRAQFGLTEPANGEAESNGSARIIDIQAATKIHDSLEVPTLEDFEKPSAADIHNYEITTYRSEDAYKDHRRPDNVVWGESLEQDLERRDFTINALALRVDDSLLEELNGENKYIDLEPGQFEVIDPHNGLEDLGAGIVRTVGDPNTRFQEDALRLLRAIRFSVQLNMQIEESTFEAILKNYKLLEHVSWERIGAEFMKMIRSGYPREAMALLDETKLLEQIMPELLAAKAVEQGGHHETDVWTHSLDALAACPSKDSIVRLATLLHDIGKPVTYDDKSGGITFYNHEVVGARIAKKIGQRLRLSKKNQDRLFILVRYHMFYYQPENSDASIRRFMRKVGLENIDDILDLREADRLGSGARRTSWRLEEMKQRVIEQLNQPMAVKDLAISGHDLMSELGLEPGPKIGEILNALFEEVLDDPDLNTREILLEKAKTLQKD